MTQTGIGNWFGYDLPARERLRLIAAAGFDAVSLWWQWNERHAQAQWARALGLTIDSAHLPAHGADDLWRDTLAGQAYCDALATGLSECADAGIGTAVAHITGVDAPPPLSRTGLDRVRRLAERAECLGVFLALENLASLAHLDYLFTGIDTPHLGFCYDSGHAFLHHAGADCLARYASRLVCVHLHDNRGDEDAHLLIGDGLIGWEGLMAELSTRVRCAMLEVDRGLSPSYNTLYEGLGAEEYLWLAHVRLSALIPEKGA